MGYSADFGLADIAWRRTANGWGQGSWPTPLHRPRNDPEPDKADGRAADVYSLGKTLWCLAAGLRTPPPGEHRRDLEWKRLSTWASHIRALST